MGGYGGIWGDMEPMERAGTLGPIWDPRAARSIGSISPHIPPRSHDSTNRSVNKYQCRCCFCFQCCFQCCCRGASRTSSGLLVQLEALCCLVFSFLFQDDALILFDVVLRRLSFCCCCCFQDDLFCCCFRMMKSLRQFVICQQKRIVGLVSEVCPAQTLPNGVLLCISVEVDYYLPSPYFCVNIFRLATILLKEQRFMSMVQ